MALNLSLDAQDPSQLYIEGRPPPRPQPPQGECSRKPASLPDPFPQALESLPDMAFISYPQVPDDSKPSIAETNFSSESMSAPPLGRWRS